MNTSELIDYADHWNSDQSAMIRLVHELWLDLPGVTGKLRYKIPFYYRTTWMAYTQAAAGGGVEIAFIRGKDLIGLGHNLDFKCRKQIAGITFYNLKQMDIPEVKAMMMDAYLL